MSDIPPNYVIIGLLAVAGFLLGGVWVMYRQARLLAILLLIGAVIAAGAAGAWYLS